MIHSHFSYKWPSSIEMNDFITGIRHSVKNELWKVLTVWFYFATLNANIFEIKYSLNNVNNLFVKFFAWLLLEVNIIIIESHKRLNNEVITQLMKWLLTTNWNHMFCFLTFYIMETEWFKNNHNNNVTIQKVWIYLLNE